MENKKIQVVKMSLKRFARNYQLADIDGERLNTDKSAINFINGIEKNSDVRYVRS